MTALPPFPLRWMPSPHHYRGRGGVQLDTIVFHYDVVRHEPGEITTGRVFRTSREASSHFGIGRGGGVAQYVDIDDGAFHAGDGGDSRMPSTKQIEVAIATGKLFVPLADVPRTPKLMNRRSIGVEQSNRGWAPRGPNPYVAATHRNPACRSKLWESWTDVQLEHAYGLAVWLRIVRPTIWLITGHEDVTHADTLGAPGGKTDPGPLFPWVPLLQMGFTRIYYDFERHGWAVQQGATQS